MKLLAIDTASERCSVALLVGDTVHERSTDTHRAHAELILPMVDEVLHSAGLSLRDLDAIAYGRGPGAFTGVRIAIAVVQGLAFGAGLATVGISNLAAVAQQAARPGEEVLVCMDARMGELYWGRFALGANERWVRAVSAEGLSRPEQIVREGPLVLAGTGFGAHPDLAGRLQAVRIHPAMLPRAIEIAHLARPIVESGAARPAHTIEPVYLRDQVTFVKSV